MTLAALPTREATQAKLDLRTQAASRHRASQTYGVAERFEETVARHGQQPCLRYGDEVLSYRQVNNRINQAAFALHGLGVRAGQVVALCMENRPAFIYAWLALAKLGAVAAFLNTNVSGKALAHALQATGARVAIVGEECLALFATFAAQGKVSDEPTPQNLSIWLWPDAEKPAADELHALAKVNLQQLCVAASTDNPPLEWRAGVVAENSAIYIFTSGTTGLPKAALISHARWLIAGDVMRVSLGITHSDCFYTFLPLYHGAAALSAASTAIAAGACLALRRKFSRREFWPDVRRQHITVCQYVGEICHFLLSSPATPEDQQHSLRVMVGTGMAAELWEQWVARFGAMDIFEGWGATEANTSTLNVDNRVGSCGRVPDWNKTNLRIVKFDVDAGCHVRGPDGFLQLCAPGEVGEAIGMVFAMPDSVAGRFEGYTSTLATEGKLLRNVFRAGDAWWSSGDLLRCDDDGYCWFVDRIGDTFRWKSENVSTTEVADALGDLPGLDAVNIYGVLVPGHTGRAGMAALVMAPGAVFEPAALYALALQRLPRYAAPLFVRLAPEADMTGNYKLRKVDLQRQGFDAAQVTDPLFVRDDRAKTYVPLTPAALAKALGA